MGGTCKTMPLLFILITFITITEGCNIRLQDFKYVPEPADFSGPNTRQCVPCKREEDARGGGGIWSELYQDYAGLAEDPSPRFGFDIGPIVTPSPPCCSTGTTTTTTAAPTQPPLTRLQNATGCGEKGSNRVVGGEEAGENEFPWMCAILNSDNSYYTCGATLLSCNPTIIVSAAHCFEGANGQPGGKKISCGAHRMNANGASPLDTNEQRLTITQIINHPQYSSFNFFGGDGSNDIAVIKVNGNFGCSAGKIWPACLPDKTPKLRGLGKDYSNWMGHSQLWRSLARETSESEAASCYRPSVTASLLGTCTDHHIIIDPACTKSSLAHLVCHRRQLHFLKFLWQGSSRAEGAPACCCGFGPALVG